MSPQNAVVQQNTVVQPVVQQLVAHAITSENFRPFGQLILPIEDGKSFDADDAQLVLDQGTPRFYIMRLPRRGLQFNRITHHARCTQSLGSLGGKEWFIAVAPPGDELQLSHLTAFRIRGDCFIKLNVGTWHAGPYFEAESFIDFYNLELSDTNVVDHITIDLATTHNLEFVICP